MSEIPIFRIRNERMDKAKFTAIAQHLGLRGEPVATDEALFLQDKTRAMAYAQPGSRFAGLLFFNDQSQGIAEPVDRVPGVDVIENWTADFLKRFHLGPGESKDERLRVAFTPRAVRIEAITEQGERRMDLKRTPLKTDIIADLRINDIDVAGPRGKVRMVFKNAKAPAMMHRALWETLEVFETRRLLTENDVYRIIGDRLTPRGATRKTWSLVRNRLAYFAGEFIGGPDLLLPYYFAEVEFRDPKDQERTRQGPRQLLQIPATP